MPVIRRAVELHADTVDNATKVSTTTMPAQTSCIARISAQASCAGR
jgi:hypothetical protein